MTTLILGIDAGNYNAKVVGPYGSDIYRTAICEWFPRNVGETWGEDDMEFQIGNRRGYAGTVAAFEDPFGGGAMYGESKVHEDTKVRVLLAIHRYLEKYSLDATHITIVTGQPIKTHTPAEKDALENMLRGTHEYSVNGKERKITLVDVGVAPEGSGAFWSNPQEGEVRIIDVGSGTVNCATFVDKRHVNAQSGTFNYGIETVNSGLGGFAHAISKSVSSLRWRNTDATFVCGGVANEILPHLVNYIPTVRTLVPQLQHADGSAESMSPTYANAAGFYRVAELTFG